MYGPADAHTSTDALTSSVIAAGGVPVLAHPATHDKWRALDDANIRTLVDAGLAGLEVGHRDNTESGRKWLLKLAAKFDLVVTGSSDYHGEGKPNRLGENTTSPEVYAAIVAQATGSKPFEG